MGLAAERCQVRATARKRSCAAQKTGLGVNKLTEEKKSDEAVPQARGRIVIYVNPV